MWPRRVKAIYPTFLGYSRDNTSHPIVGRPGGGEGASGRVVDQWCLVVALLFPLARHMCIACRTVMGKRASVLSTVRPYVGRFTKRKRSNDLGAVGEHLGSTKRITASFCGFPFFFFFRFFCSAVAGHIGQP